MHPLHDIKNTQLKLTAVQGVTRIMNKTSAQRCHQQLGHVGKQILKSTAQFSKGLGVLNTSDLSTCQTCHLGKTQRYVCRVPRSIPNEPLY